MSQFPQFAAQVERIKIKLSKARKADPEFKAFSAKSHRYELNDPVSLEDVRAFEQAEQITLPPDFVAFLTEVGHGGPSHNGAGAGPFYGLFPLDKLRSYMGHAARLPVRVFPRMSRDQWDELSAPLDDPNLSNEEMDTAETRLYGGLLLFCEQGCGNETALVLSGDHVGRVVNIAQDGLAPSFAYEATFLDWYERWLDEVINGVALQPGAGWFGLRMGGTAEDLIEIAVGSSDLRREALFGLLNNLTADAATCDKLEVLCRDGDPFVRKDAVFALTKFDASRAMPFLTELINGDDEACLIGCQAVHWYAKDHYDQFADCVASRALRIESADTAQFALYVLAGGSSDNSHVLRDFAARDNAKLRGLAAYELGKLDDRAQHVDTFLTLLDDPDADVLRSTLGALRGLDDKRLLSAYAKLAHQFGDQSTNMGAYLTDALRTFGYDSIAQFQASYPEKKSGFLARLFGQ